MNYKNEILNRGFFVVSNFLTSEETECLANDFRQGSQSDNKVYTLGIANPANIEPLHPRIKKILDEISTGGEFTPRVIRGGAFFAIENGINFPWHQDHESYFINQSHWNYINLYIPVIKPVQGKTNLSIVPADNFQKLDENLWKKLQGRGATSAIREGGKTCIRDDHAGGFLGEFDAELKEIAETPQLNAGDALFMRGDLFHQTEDTDTERVAVSIRIWNEQDIVTRAHFETSCPAKEWYKQQNPRVYGKLAEVFEQKAEMTLGELISAAYQ
ncbi:MAG: hypothetical protein AAF512_12220 [Pseudomonadota bacterium]